MDSGAIYLTIHKKLDDAAWSRRIENYEFSLAALHKSNGPRIRVSGRLKIAQRFITGIGRNRDEVCEADG
jgi:hypothetical protein